MMKVNEVLSKKDIYSIIERAALNHKDETFNYYTTEDIYQIVWTIALEKLSDFNFDKALEKKPEKALEHWLNSVISNRLSNLYRDEYVVPKQLKFGKNTNVIDPISIHEIEFNILDNMITVRLENKELWEHILNNLTEYELYILDSLLSGENITSYYKIKFVKRIKEIMNEY